MAPTPGAVRQPAASRPQDHRDLPGPTSEEPPWSPEATGQFKAPPPSLSNKRQNIFSTWCWQRARLKARCSPAGRAEQRPGHPVGAWQGRHPNSQLTCACCTFHSHGTLPPSPPLRLLCAEAAFRCLVLQGGEGAWEGRLTPPTPRRQAEGQRNEREGQGGRGEERNSTWKGEKKQSQY